MPLAAALGVWMVAALLGQDPPHDDFVEVDNPAFPGPEREPLQPPPPVPDPGRKYDAADIAPYFAEGPLAQARAEFDKGHFPRARALLEPLGDSNPVRYLRAMASFRALDYAKAADEFARLADDYPAMRDHCLTHAGISDEELNKWDAAAEVYGRVQRDSRLYPDARLGLYRAMRKRGDLDGARVAVEPIAEIAAPGWGRDVAAEALIDLADLAHAQKDPAAERAALVRIYAAHPLAFLAHQAERRLGTPPVDAQVARAEALGDVNHNGQAIAALQPLLAQLKLPDPVACRAFFALGRALRKERQHGRAIATLQPVVDQCTDPDLRPRALYTLGQSRAIVDPTHAPATYEQLVKEYPAHAFADDALFYASDLYFHNGEPDSALARLKELADHYPTSDFAGEALFRIFWIRRERGESQLALAALDSIEQIFKDFFDPYQLERARYWRARVLATRNDPAAADVYEKLATEHPTTYYGYLAVRRLGELDAERGKKVFATLNAPPEADEVWP